MGPEGIVADMFLLRSAEPRVQFGHKILGILRVDKLLSLSTRKVRFSPCNRMGGMMSTWIRRSPSLPLNVITDSCCFLSTAIWQVRLMDIISRDVHDRKKIEAALAPKRPLLL
jgi:hypothetical protein